MDNQFLVRALAAHSAICTIHDWTKIDASVFMKRANDAACIIESYADGSMVVKEDAMGRTWFGRKAVEPNTDADTAKEQPIKVADNDDPIARVRHLLKTHGNSAGGLATLIHAGVVTSAEARVAAGLPPLAKAA